MLPLQLDDWADCLACQQPTIMKSDRIFRRAFFSPGFFVLFFFRVVFLRIVISLTLLFRYLFRLFSCFNRFDFFVMRLARARARAQSASDLHIRWTLSYSFVYSNAIFIRRMVGILPIPHFIDQYTQVHHEYVSEQIFNPTVEFQQKRDREERGKLVSSNRRRQLNWILLMKRQVHGSKDESVLGNLWWLYEVNCQMYE